MPVLGEAWQNRVVKSKIYQRFYKYHAYYWWFFWMLMLLHVFAAVGHTVYSP
jgi:cytochrome b561